MKKIVYVVYHDLNKEARSMELLKCCRILGHVDIVTYAIPLGYDNINIHLIDKNSPFALLHFLRKAKNVILSVDPDIVVLHDNDCSALIPFIRKNCIKAQIVYDSSELVIDKTLPGTSKKNGWVTVKNDGVLIKIKQILTRFRQDYEKKYLREVDCVIAANIERAKIMQDFFNLTSAPVIFNNMHRIDDEFDEDECRSKFSRYIKENGFNILFGGGINEERKTFDYIKAFCSMSNKYNLIIAGSASNVARKKYDKLLSMMDNDRIHYLGFVSRAELRYLMQKCQASVVIFDKDSYNTLYCESGKCYESLFEGTPILASENPPLKRLCEENRIGVSNDDYSKGMEILSKNYDFYINKVKEFVEKVDYKERVIKLVNEIEYRLANIDLQ